MKARLATALSVVGVVVTGGAAFAMNSSILDTDSTAQGSPALAAVVAVDPAVAVADAATIIPTADAPVAVASAGVVAEAVAALPSPSAPVDTKKRPESLRPLALTPDTTGASVVSTPPAVGTATTSPVAPATSTTAPTTSAAPSTPVVRQFNVEDFASVFLTVNGTQLGIDRIALAPGSPYTVSNKYVSGDTVRITLASPARTVEFSARLSNGEIVAAVSDPTSALLPPPRREDHDDDDEHEEREHDDEHEDREHHDREDDDD